MLLIFNDYLFMDKKDESGFFQKHICAIRRENIDKLFISREKIPNEPDFYYAIQFTFNGYVYTLSMLSSKNCSEYGAEQELAHIADRINSASEGYGRLNN